MKSHSDKNRRAMFVIGAAVGVWGLTLAVGAYLELGSETQSADRDPRKFLIVAIVTTVFLTFWAVASALRRRRVARHNRDESHAENNE